MPLYITPAVILHTLGPTASRIRSSPSTLTLDFGKVKGIAKGAKRSRKRFGSRLEIAYYVKATFFEKETSSLVRLSNCDLIRSFEGLREDIQRLAWASYFIELVNAMTAEKIQNKALFKILVAFLAFIDKGMLKEEIQRVFEIRFLSCLGYQPQLDHCTHCQKKLSGERFFFSPLKGGVICSACAASFSGLIPVSLGTIKTLLLAHILPLEKVSRISFSPQSLKESVEAGAVESSIGKFAIIK